MDRIRTVDLKRELPDWAEVVRTINDVDIYNMSLTDNIFACTKSIPDVPAIDYFGNVIKYGELPEQVRHYVNGFKLLGIKPGDVVTLCLAVSVENILSLLALNKLGAVSNNPNFLFLKNDLKRYTLEKKSKTLVILDFYLPFVIDELENAGITTVVVASLQQYLPEDKKYLFRDMSKLPKSLQAMFTNTDSQTACRKKIKSLKSIKFITMEALIKKGAARKDPLPSGPVDIDRDVSYSYTSGTTGKPKCIVYKELSGNALLEFYKTNDPKDHVGDRVLHVIPYTHVTGERFCGYLQMASGKTIVPQPIYNKETFAMDLVNFRCNWVTAAPSFYLAGVQRGFIGHNALAHLEWPIAGGESITKANVAQINKWLQMNGCPHKLTNGGGASEEGSSTLTNFFLDEDEKTNETGLPFEPGVIARLVDENGNEVATGTRGLLEISTPAAADRYLGNPEATARRWYYDENGIRWGRTGDVAIRDSRGAYTILGRHDDSCVDKTGKLVYLFDIENKINEQDPMAEWEITYNTDGEGDNHIVAQVVLKDEYVGREAEAISLICERYPEVEAVKIFDKFGSSQVTGKRDIQKLKAYRIGYYAAKGGALYKIDYVSDGVPSVTHVKKSEIRIEEF